MKDRIDTNHPFFASLQKPVVFFELKTTGISISQDRIVELTFIKFEPNGKEPIQSSYRFNPLDREVSHSAYLEHGIDFRSLSQAPLFSDKALEIYSHFYHSDIVGTNVLFHRLILESEFARCGLKLSEETRHINPINIWHNMTSSGLKEACSYYLGETLEKDSFSSLRATANVLLAQINKHQLSPSVGELQASSFNSDNLLHLAINKYTTSINNYRSELDKKSLNTDIIQEVKNANKDVANFLTAISKAGVEIEYDETVVTFTRANASINLRYAFFSDNGLELKPTKSTMLGAAL
ncbi:MAG: hypothetical protein IM631_13095 [Cytophagales bacterium]|nr:hypothetical protein [Cytophagales bacterium]MCA6372309.1 hypothetical protein [Cytophagales bacterium]MCA6382455.1 hypothetical protein [Cytophagales bacterium]